GPDGQTAHDLSLTRPTGGHQLPSRIARPRAPRRSRRRLPASSFRHSFAAGNGRASGPGTGGSMLRKITIAGVLFACPCAALAQDASAAADSGDTAWILVASALVLLMALPGLGLFYGGLVRAKNVLSVLLQIGAVAALASLLWIVGGYTLAFGTSAGG